MYHGFNARRPFLRDFHRYFDANLVQVTKKERQIKKEAKSAEQQVEEEIHNESMDMGLTARLGLSGDKKTKKPAKPREKKEPGTTKSPTKSPKKGKKKSKIGYFMFMLYCGKSKKE